MKKPPSKRTTVEMQAEYDFSGGVRGKYASRNRRGTNVVLLDPELAKAFPDSKSVNDEMTKIVEDRSQTFLKAKLADSKLGMLSISIPFPSFSGAA